MQQPPAFETPAPGRPSIGQGRPSNVQKSGASGGLIVLIVLGIVAVLVGIVVLVIELVGNTTRVFTGGDASAVVRDVRALRDKAGGVVYVAEIENTGGETSGAIAATLTLLDAQRAPLGTRTCAPSVLHVAPHERVPCVLSFGAVANPASLDWKIDARPLGDGVHPIDLATSGVTLGQKGAQTVLQGSVRNGSSVAAKRVVVIASLYGADKTLVGAAMASVANLEPGASSPFAVTVPVVGPAPVTFAARAVGYR